MKKKYIRPVSQGIELETLSMLAGSGDNPSVNVDDTQKAGAGESYTNKGGWNSSLWNDTEE